MSIENDLSSIAQSLAKIAAHLTADRPVVSTGNYVNTVQPVAPVVAPIGVGKIETKAPTGSWISDKDIKDIVVQVLAPTPVPVTPVQASPFSAVFANQAELTAFVMDSYKALGPIKGAKIQDVLTSVGVKNINEVKPEMYAAVKTGVEALKV